MKENGAVKLKGILLVGAVATFLMVVISSYAWTQIPSGAQVCTHWNASGDCDAYGTKFMGLFLMPIITAGTILFVSLISRVEPRKINLAKSGAAFSGVIISTILFLLATHAVLMLNILGSEISISSWLSFLLGLMFIATGFFMSKLHSNFIFGIRTPWTLSSNLAWNKTHKLGGRLWIAQGLLFIAFSLFTSGEVWVYLLLASIIATSSILVVYSYLIWKKDPDRMDL